MKPQIREEVGRVDITSKTIRPKELSKDEMTKKAAAERKRLSRRGETSGLIPEVPQELKEEHKEYIKQSQETSMAEEIWKRMNMRGYKGNGKKDTRKEMGGDWWNTPELIAVAEKGLSRQRKEERVQAVKDFFYVWSGRKFFNDHNRKKKEERENKAIVQEFFDDFYLKAFSSNRQAEMSEVLAEFLCFIYGRKGWRGIMTNEMAKVLAVSFIKQKNIKEVVNPDIKTLLVFYIFWRDGEKIR